MIWVLLQSESPWQRSDAITFLSIFVFLCIRSFFKESLKKFVPQLWQSFNKFYESSFRHILKRSFKKQERLLNRALNITNFSPRFCVYK